MKDSLNTPEGARVVSAVDAPVYWWEIVFFALVGVGGGVLGGLWNRAWNWMFPLRPKSNIGKVLFAVLTSIGTSALVFSQAYALPMCRTNGGWTCGDADNGGAWCRGPRDNSTCIGIHAQCVNASEWICTGGSSAGKVCRGRGDDCHFHGGKCEPHTSAEEHEHPLPFGLQLGCQAGEYDELATIYFGVRERSLVRLFTQAEPHQPFSNTALLLAGFSYCVLLLFAYGMAIPAGLFMPSVMIGGCLGRFVGQVVKAYIDPTVFAGAYALAGAAAMLAGVQRATISLVVIIIEGTANVHFLLPIVVTTCTAKFVGNFFGHEGVYEIGMRKKKLRFLEHEPEWEMDLCVAGDVMATPVATLPIVARVGDIAASLKRCRHNGFPVLSLHDEDAPAPKDALAEAEERRSGGAAAGAIEAKDVPYGKFEGIVLRAQLRHILSARYQADGDDPNGLWHRVTAESPDDIKLDGDVELYELMASTNRIGREGVSDWESTDFAAADLARLVNLGPYMNAACYTVAESCPLTRAFKLFRNLGLRHLPVTDCQNHVVGMLSRASFAEGRLHEAMEHYYREEERHQRHDESTTPRLDGRTQVQRFRARRPIPGPHGGAVGGPVVTWQTRLLAYLEPPPRPGQ
jgi:CBS domain-containing protein